MRVVCVSDTHGLHSELHAASRIPDGDVFVHAGDFTDTGERHEVIAFNAFLATLPHKYKIVIAGNHESTFDRDFYPHNWHHYGHAQQYDPVEVRALLTNALYLEDQAVLIDGFLFYGTPWQPEFCNWAFNLPRGDALVAKWQKIPSQVDFLITHSPPMGRGDQVGHLRVGCADLLRQVQSRIQPTFHVFGHVHEGYGASSDGITTFMNASSCTHEYEAINPPMVVELTKPRFRHDVNTESNQKLRYDVLLHEQLRVCSQKPVFVPVTVVNPLRTGHHPHGPCHSHSHHQPHEPHSKSKSLKEFRVDGTTSALLFESTLKLRPVRAEQTRALRYLFHQGFQSSSGGGGGELDGGEGQESSEGGGIGPGGQGGEREETSSDPNREPSSAATLSGAARREARRRASLSRRVTMGVIEELSETTRDTVVSGPPMAFTAVDSGGAHTTKDVCQPQPQPAQPQPTQRRARRDKTLHRREAVPKLATMVEEQEEAEPVAAVEEKEENVVVVEEKTVTIEERTIVTVEEKTVTLEENTVMVEQTVTVEEKKTVTVEERRLEGTNPPPQQLQQQSASTVVAVVVAPECIMCKFNVPGHVHAGAVPSAGAPPPPPPASSTASTQPTATNVPLVATETLSAPPPAPLAAPPKAVECILCKYKVAGHVHPGSEPAVTTTSVVVATTNTVVVEEADVEEEDEDQSKEEETKGESAVGRKAVGPKRLSSWF